MNPEIEELRKFAKAPVTKARLEKLSVATVGARSLLDVLEPKSGDAEEFESAQSDLESALDELESACDELDGAEEKDEREDAQDQISSALDDVLTYFDDIVPLAIVRIPADDAQVVAECEQRLAEYLALSAEQKPTFFATWLQGASEIEKNKKLECLTRLIDKKMRRAGH